MHVYYIGPINSTLVYGDKHYNLHVLFTAQKVATLSYKLVWVLLKN